LDSERQRPAQSLYHVYGMGGLQGTGFAPWRLTLFGPFRAEHNGRSAEFRTRKTAGLLAYLAYYSGRSVSKEVLVETFWPDADAESGRHSLRMAVSSLRSALAEPGWDSERHIVSERDTLTASLEGFATDVAAFLTAIGDSRLTSDSQRKAELLERGLSYYSGPFLQGYSQSWVVPQALELEERFAHAVSELVELVSVEDLRLAVEIGRRALALHPNREDLHVALIGAYARASEAAMAVKQFEELERMLDEIWGETPGAEAVAALETPARAVVAWRSKRDGDAATPFAQKPFFGRGPELAELRELLDPTRDFPRLITLVGLGGTGKTRLAERTMQDLSDSYRGKIWFVSLVGAESTAQVHEALQDALPSTNHRNVDILEAVAAEIGPEPSLLVLDNLEQVTPESRLVTEFLTRNCPRLRILATSRIALGTPGERVLMVSSLPVPEDFRDLAALRASPCVQLFAEAAQAVRPGFSVEPANAQSVLLLCGRLEGIPLALELAAAMLATKSPAQVLASLGRTSDLATSRHELPLRHRSLESIIQWSCGLLESEERAAFAKLSVCRGGFNLDLAAKILGATADSSVQELVRCSLAGWKEVHDELRFEMLETVREVAARSLEQVRSDRLEAQTRHFAHIRDLCCHVESALDETDVWRWLGRIEAETDNILVAIETAAEGVVAADEGWRMVLPLQTYMGRKGRTNIWAAPLESLLRATEPELRPELRARAHGLLAHARYGMRDIMATFQHSIEALNAADQSGDPELRIRTRSTLATSASVLGEFDLAQRELETAAELLAELDMPAESERCHTNLGWLHFDRGNEAAAEHLFHEALRHAERSGSPSAISAALTGLACAVGHTRYEDSQELFDRATSIREEMGSPEAIGHTHFYRSLTDYRHGWFDAGLKHLRRSFRVFVDHGVALGQTPLTIGGNLMSVMGRFDAAAACWGKAESARRRYGMKMLPNLRPAYDAEVAKCAKSIGEEALESAMALGSKLTDAALLDLLFGATPAVRAPSSFHAASE
jgi:predicted ATPase/DNA-binding SARP family transcriptional activator